MDGLNTMTIQSILLEHIFIFKKHKHSINVPPRVTVWSLSAVFLLFNNYFPVPVKDDAKVGALGVLRVVGDDDGRFAKAALSDQVTHTGVQILVHSAEGLVQQEQICVGAQGSC